MKSRLRTVICLLVGFAVVAMVGAGTRRMMQYHEDTVSQTAELLTMAGFVRNDTLAALAGTDGDRAPGQVNANGALYTDEVNASAMATDLAAIEVINTAIQAAAEGAEDELDGTTTGGPLAKMVHGDKTLLLARIDVDLAAGADSGNIIAASNEIFVVELLITVDAQCQLQFTDGAETASAAGVEFCLPAYGGVHLKRDPGYRFVLDDGEVMSLDDIDGGTVEVRGYVWYYQE